MVQYKKFQLDSLFDIRYGKFIPKRKAGTKVPFVTARSGNNGIAYYVDSKPMCKGDALTIASDGSVGETYYQDKPFSASNIVVIMEPHDDVRKAWTPRAALYLSALIKQYARAKYDWGRKYSVNRVRATQLELPVTPAGHPDFAYMTARIRELEAQRIRELEAQRIRELEAYLQVTGLDDTTLSEDEIKALKHGGGQVNWKKFKIGEIFEKKTAKGYPKKLENLTPVDNGYHTFGQNIHYQHEQRIKMSDKYLFKVNRPILAYASSTGSVGMINESFYRSGDNGAFQALLPKFDDKRITTMLYILVIMKQLFAQFNYNTNIRGVLDLDIQLPVTSTGDIDFDYMQTYIRALEKQTIKGVVEYKDKVIQETKKVVNG